MLFLAYYYPGWHTDPARNPDPDWSEWDVVYKARPRFDGHRLPRIPIEGKYSDDSFDVLRRKICLAKMYGIDGFISCFYWRQGARILEAPIRHIASIAEGSSFRFALMWVNRLPYSSLPLDISGPHYRASETGLRHVIDDGRRVRSGAQDFIALIEYLVETYFRSPAYLLIDGCPVLQLYSVEDYLSDLQADLPVALRKAERICRDAGLNGLHLVGIVHRSHGWLAHARQAGLSGLTSYVLLPEWDGPAVQFYTTLASSRKKDWQRIAALSGLPYSPSVTVGWDSSPRGVWYPLGENDIYPWAPIVIEDRPEHFAEHLKDALAYSPPDGIIRIASWNEWSEGHYLEPDIEDGYSRLAVVRELKGRNDG